MPGSVARSRGWKLRGQLEPITVDRLQSFKNKREEAIARYDASKQVQERERKVSVLAPTRIVYES